MEKQMLLSVIMPVFNAREYLEDSVNSIRNQTMQDWELILVDDASQDGSGAMCDELANMDSRIRALHLKENKGAGHARNCGMKLATGTYLSFMDSDDAIEPALFEKIQKSILTHNPDEVVWGVTEDYYDETDKVASCNQISVGNLFCSDQEKVRKTVIRLEEKTLFGYLWNHAYRREIIENNHILINDMVLYEDYFFNLEAVCHVTTMDVLDVVDYHYKKRMNESVTARFVPEYFDLCTKRVGSMYACYQEWKLYSPFVRDVLGKIYLRYSLSGLMRNCDPRAKMNHGQKKNWVRELAVSKLYEQTAMHCKVTNKALRILQICINHRWITPCLIMGNALHVIKIKMPMLFSRKKLVK